MISVRIDRVVRDAVLFSLVAALCAAALGAWWLHATAVSHDPPIVRFIAWTLFGGVATALLTVLMSRTFRVGTADGWRTTGAHKGEESSAESRTTRPQWAVGRQDPAAVPTHNADDRLSSVGLPNALTLVRFVLIAPTVVLLADRRYLEALVCYIVLFATDVADGIVARRRGLGSDFGVVADPLADVASTFAIFTVFVIQGLCPPWLYGLLAFRYAMLFVGSIGLFWATGPFEFKSTIPGKIVGVVQAAAASLVMVGPLGGGLDPTIEGVLFTFLGIGFASIVVSQTIIGWRLARRR